MSKQSFCEKERSHINKLNTFQLSNQYKKVGFILALSAFVFLIITKITAIEIIWITPILKNVLVAGLLLVSISKEKIEDEFIDSLRSQSYRLAVILTVLYAIFQPFVNYVVDVILSKNLADYSSNFSYFQVLVFMLFIQIAFFEQMKRLHN